MACDEAGVIPVINEETELEVTRRTTETENIYFVINFKDEELLLPSVFVGKKDLLTGDLVGEGEKLKKYDVRIIEVPLYNDTLPC